MSALDSNLSHLRERVMEGTCRCKIVQSDANEQQLNCVQMTGPYFQHSVGS